jgi:hypothetical protein
LLLLRHYFHPNSRQLPAAIGCHIITTPLLIIADIIDIFAAIIS